MFKTFKRKRLIKAIQNNKLKLAEGLMKNGGDASVSDKKGRSLLAIAYNYDSKDLIEFLRSTGLREEINELYNYAVRCFNRAEYEEARKRFNELVQLMPGNSKTHYYLGNVTFKIFEETQNKPVDGKDNSELLENAVKNINTSLDVYQEDHRLEKVKISQAYYILGYYCKVKEKMEEARQYFQKAVHNDPNNEVAQVQIHQMQ